jgi:hypothetical protein
MDLATRLDLQAAEVAEERCRAWYESWAGEASRAVQRLANAKRQKDERKSGASIQRLVNEWPLRFWAWKGTEETLAALRRQATGEPDSQLEADHTIEH